MGVLPGLASLLPSKERTDSGVGGGWMMEGASGLSGALWLTASCYKLMGKQQRVPVLLKCPLNPRFGRPNAS